MIEVLGRRGTRTPGGGGVAPPAPPVNTVAPVVSLPALYEIGETASGTNGTWTGATSFEYRWTLRGVVMGSATANTFQLLGADLGGVGPALTSELFGDALFASGQGPDVQMEVRATGPGGVSAWVPSSNSLRFDWAQYADVYQLIDERGQTFSGSDLTIWANQGAVAGTYTGIFGNYAQSGTPINGFSSPRLNGTSTRLNSTMTARNLVGGSPLDGTRYAMLVRVARFYGFPAGGAGDANVWQAGVQVPDASSGNLAFNGQRDAAGTFTARSGVNANVAPTGYRVSNLTVGSDTGVHVQETLLGGGTLVERWDGVAGGSATFNGHSSAPGAGNTTTLGCSYQPVPTFFLNADLATEVCLASGSPFSSAKINTIRAVLAGKYGAATGYTYP